MPQNKYNSKVKEILIRITIYIISYFLGDGTNNQLKGVMW